MNVTFVVGVFAVFGIATLGLALYRWVLTGKTQGVVHLGPGEEGQIPQQTEIARKLVSVDRWGKTLTVVTAILGLGLAAAYLYQAWQDPASAPNNFYRQNSPVGQ